MTDLSDADLASYATSATVPAYARTMALELQRRRAEDAAAKAYNTPAIKAKRALALSTLEEMANRASVPMDLWDRHANAVLTLAKESEHG